MLTESNTTKRCTRCGEIKPTDAFYLQNGTPRAMCKRCTCESSRKHHRVCNHCGAEFLCSTSQLNKGNGRFCSLSCASSFRNGERSPIWKGGRSVHPAGYITTHASDGRYLAEHRIVMEQHLGRRLRTDEHVHHINHDRSDNRIENLCIMTPTEHAQLHSRMTRWSKSFDRCVLCGTKTVKHNAHGYCILCYRKPSLRKGRFLAA
jgi:hypothetical protein